MLSLFYKGNCQTSFCSGLSPLDDLQAKIWILSLEMSKGFISGLNSSLRGSFPVKSKVLPGQSSCYFHHQMLLAFCRLPLVFHSTQDSKKDQILVEIQKCSRLSLSSQSYEVKITDIIAETQASLYLSIQNVFLGISCSLYTKCFQISSLSCE